MGFSKCKWIHSLVVLTIILHNFSSFVRELTPVASLRLSLCQALLLPFTAAVYWLVSCTLLPAHCFIPRLARNLTPSFHWPTAGIIQFHLVRSTDSLISVNSTLTRIPGWQSWGGGACSSVWMAEEECEGRREFHFRFVRFYRLLLFFGAQLSH